MIEGNQAMWNNASREGAEVLGSLHLMHDSGCSAEDVARQLSLPADWIRKGLRVSAKAVQEGPEAFEPFYVDWNHLWFQS